MSDDQIRDSLHEIEPEAGAQQRMYANILKKAAMQNAAPAAEAAPAAKPKTAKIKHIHWQRYSGIAAAAVLAIGVGTFSMRQTSLTAAPADSLMLESAANTSDSLALAGNPMQYVDSAADFAALNITLDAPENAENRTYVIANGEAAEVFFDLDGHSYLLCASRSEEDFSGMYGKVLSAQTVDESKSAVLEKIEPDQWRAGWKTDGVTYYLINSDQADEAQMRALMQKIMGT